MGGSKEKMEVGWQDEKISGMFIPPDGLGEGPWFQVRGPKFKSGMLPLLKFSRLSLSRKIRDSVNMPGLM